MSTPWLIALVFLLLAAVGWYWYESRWDRRLFASGPGRVTSNLRARAAKAFLDAYPETQVLDVRSAAEYRGGSLPGALHLSFGDADFVRKAGALDRDRPVLVYCAGGYRSRKAVEILKTMGFADIRNLHRGWHSWRLARLPVAGPAGRKRDDQAGRGV